MANNIVRLIVASETVLKPVRQGPKINYLEHRVPHQALRVRSSKKSKIAVLSAGTYYYKAVVRTRVSERGTKQTMVHLLEELEGITNVDFTYCV